MGTMNSVSHLTVFIVYTKRAKYVIFKFVCISGLLKLYVYDDTSRKPVLSLIKKIHTNK